jgi:PLP dependent protein
MDNLINPASLDSLTERWQQLSQALTGWTGTLVGVTKQADPTQIQQAYTLGLRHFGENRVQHLLDKQQTLATTTPAAHWHMIGTLQRNKLSKLVGRVSLIHSVSSLAMAQQISTIAETKGLVQPVLLQVNLAAEPQKDGFLQPTLLQDFAVVVACPGLRVDGLMLIAPHGADAPLLLRLFTGLYTLRDTLQLAHNHALPELSMGMSQDFTHAVACGATIIRVGSYLFQ